jgi:hypothetical protein
MSSGLNGCFGRKDFVLTVDLKLIYNGFCRGGEIGRGIYIAEYSYFRFYFHLHD